jgi:hypothetical protein
MKRILILYIALFGFVIGSIDLLVVMTLALAVFPPLGFLFMLIFIMVLFGIYININEILDEYLRLNYTEKREIHDHQML